MRGTKYEARREGVRETPGLYKVLLDRTYSTYWTEVILVLYRREEEIFTQR